MPQMALGVHPHAFRSSAAPPNRQFAPADQYLFCPGYRPAAWLKCFASGWQAPASAPTTVSTRPIRVVAAAKRRGVSLICVHFLSAEGSSAEGSAQRGQPDLRSFPAFPVEHTAQRVSTTRTTRRAHLAGTLSSDRPEMRAVPLRKWPIASPSRELTTRGLHSPPAIEPHTSGCFIGTWRPPKRACWLGPAKDAAGGSIDGRARLDARRPGKHSCSSWKCEKS